MKIGIITLPLRLNYGGILQAYALQTILQRMGHEVQVINPPQGKYVLQSRFKSLIHFKRFLLNKLGKSNIPVYAEELLNTQWPIISQHTQSFIDNKINVLKCQYSKVPQGEFEVLVVGSDQVWRPAYSNLYQCFLKFAESWSVKRIAYAASFGTDEHEYTEDQIKECGWLISKFDAISVRESSGVDLCKDYFHRDAEWVLDPTLLLHKEDYIHLFKDKVKEKSPGNLLVYILDENEHKRNLIADLAKSKGLSPFNVKSKSDEKYAPVEDKIQPPVEEWLRGFYDADFVITDSFHACAFSIIFRKPFLVFANESRGLTRFYSLLTPLGIDDRIITKDTNFYHLKEIDFENVKLKLEQRISSSKSFLKKNLYG